MPGSLYRLSQWGRGARHTIWDQPQLAALVLQVAYLTLKSWLDERQEKDDRTGRSSTLVTR